MKIQLAATLVLFLPFFIFFRDLNLSAPNHLEIPDPYKEFSFLILATGI